MDLISSQGMTIQVMRFRDNAGVGVIPWGLVTQIIPDPRIEETAALLKALGQPYRQHTELRKNVQRLFTGAKGKNVKEYAQYIADGLLGKLGKAWSTPPLCLWSSAPLKFLDEANGVAALRYGSYSIVAIDAETQLAARYEIEKNPAEYGFNTNEETGEVIDFDFPAERVAFEMYWDIDEADARQIFHDRNWLTIAVDKNLALGMDQRDLGTTLAKAAIVAEVDVAGKMRPFAHYVNTNKRQLGAKDEAWVTLSAIRSMAVTTLFGKPGFEQTSNKLDEVPAVTNLDEAMSEISELMSMVFQEFTADFETRSAITAPAILAGIGALLHHATPWTREPKLTRERVSELLAQVHWDRGQQWNGVGAKITPKGALSFAGGVKDQGYAVYEALLNEYSPSGRQIRGS